MAERKDGKPYKKATKQVVADRVDQVYQLLMKHRSRQDIIEYCAEHFDVTERQTDMYLSRARERYLRIANQDPEEALQDLLTKASDLYERATESGDLEVARKLVSDLTRMRGLDRQQEINVNVRQERVADIPTETLGEFIRNVSEAKKAKLAPSAQTSEQSDKLSKEKEPSE